ncbi:MAG: hypothetical protein M3361_22460 [Candidatus Tectomicrobia bacterium]|nr:hypothetical protein [Candidatus Tectomicrobia bacterium]
MTHVSTADNQWVVLTPLQRVFGHPVLSVVMAAGITHVFQPLERLLSTYFHAVNGHLAA